MAFPTSINPATPPGSESIGLGDDQIRALKQFICDIFGIPASTTFSAPIATAGATGGFGLVPLNFLTNRTGSTLTVSDVVAIDAGNATSVESADVVRSPRQFMVARSAPANLALGVFANLGINPLKAQGAIAAGQYVWKSATAFAVEDSGIAVEAGAPPPPGAIGFALAAASGGLVTTMMLGGLGPALLGDMGCRVHGIAQTINDASLTPLVFASERYDVYGMHSTSADTGRITPIVAGRYQVGASVQFAVNILGERELYLRVNGTTLIAAASVPAGSTREVLLTVSTEYLFNGTTDYVETVVYQNRGGTLDVEVEANSSPEMWARLVARV